MLYSITDIELNRYKYLVHWDRLQTLVSGGEVFPITLELDVSSACDHSCHWCVDPPGCHSNRLMPLSLAEQILAEAQTLGIKGIVFKGGGESTLHPDLPEILESAGNKGFEIGLVTHGGHLNQPKLLDTLVQHAAYVRVSIDGPTPSSRQEIHGVDDFSTLTTGLSTLVSRRGTRRHPIIGASFCLDYQRVPLIPGCIALGEQLGLNYVLIRPPFCEEVGFPAPHLAEESALLRAEIRAAAQNYRGKMKVLAGNWVGDRERDQTEINVEVETLARRDEGLEANPFNGIEHKTKRCLASSLFLVITATAEVFGCCCLRGLPEFSLGRLDYGNGQCLQAILRSENRGRIQARMTGVECLEHCTHPLSSLNELLEYLALPEKYHASFI